MKVYQITDIIPELTKPTEYSVGVFEDTPDPEIEWPHRHAFYSVVWFTQGSGINVIDFDEYKIQQNRVFTINPKQIHNWNYSIDSCGYFLLIEEPLAKQLNLDFSFPFVDIEKDDYNFIEEIFKRMLSKNNQRTAIPYLFSLLSSSETSKKSDTITKFKKMVSENLDKNLAIEQYAEKLSVTTEILNQTCKDETGFTTKQLQLDIKITEAKRLMLYSSLNTSEIAFKLGFEDNSYFSRIFKKKTAYSPAEFQKKYLKKEKKS
ncbi:AraC family transcriptional regulator [Flavobacterium piscis]|uniref:YesN/AraC family two-component response regulator n=1 Tax=Flavobacterium piscis TaxID=1114874 RepID=A0ABU1Y7V5_9FLAO|nr:AraC family transcriptional regulator [Flavobacterium piscis]MDR7210291.1 YesN/AraC family two-component response regulator [Flavobacterium piscis]